MFNLISPPVMFTVADNIKVIFDFFADELKAFALPLAIIGLIVAGLIMLLPTSEKVFEGAKKTFIAIIAGLLLVYVAAPLVTYIVSKLQNINF